VTHIKYLKSLCIKLYLVFQKCRRILRRQGAQLLEPPSVRNILLQQKDGKERKKGGGGSGSGHGRQHAPRKCVRQKQNSDTFDIPVNTHLITKIKQRWALIVLGGVTTQITCTLGAVERCCTYQYPFDHQSQATLGLDSIFYK
jgi:hypothetical protein